MQQKQFYIIVAALVTLVFAVIIFFGVRSSSIQSQPPVVSKAVAGIEPTVSEQIPTPSIEEVSGRPQTGEKKGPEKPPATLSEVYTHYPQADAGNNIVEAWARVKPEEKERVLEQLDQQIAQAHEALKANPVDKKAKHVLFISENLKKMCKANFNMSLLQSVPQEQGGLKKKSKK
ncbi:MAG: hypothetical protein PHI59_10295 [Candidatus Omnitrophica bacterium]|nr:hypothetical protein [Candidatus Omnitrophota bacterium]